MKCINELSEEIHENAVNKGFYSLHQGELNLAEKIMLCVCELSEAIEADRKGKRADLEAFFKRRNELIASMNSKAVKPDDEIDLIIGYQKQCFKTYVKDTVEDELADCMIRIMDLAGYMKIDLEKHIELKMNYNSQREHLHGKKY